MRGRQEMIWCGFDMPTIDQTCRHANLIGDGRKPPQERALADSARAEDAQ